MPRLIRADMVVDEVDGPLHPFAHERGRRTAVEAFSVEYEGRPTPGMGKFPDKREWETVCNGWDLADAIVDLNFVQDDGRTPVPQPHLRFGNKDMCKPEHVCGHRLRSLLNMLLGMNEADRTARIAASQAGFMPRRMNRSPGASMTLPAYSL